MKQSTGEQVKRIPDLVGIGWLKKKGNYHQAQGGPVCSVEHFYMRQEDEEIVKGADRPSYRILWNFHSASLHSEDTYVPSAETLLKSRLVLFCF